MVDFTSRTLPLLFADQQAIRNVMRGMQHRQTEIDMHGLATALLFFCLFFVSVWGVARLFIKSDGGDNKNRPGGLFRELCAAHGLTWSDWWFLRRLAHHHRLVNATLLFIEPHHFDPIVCGAEWQGHKARLRDLQLKLFSGLASPYPSEPHAEATR